MRGRDDDGDSQEAFLDALAVGLELFLEVRVVSAARCSDIDEQAVSLARDALECGLDRAEDRREVGVARRQRRAFEHNDARIGVYSDPEVRALVAPIRRSDVVCQDSFSNRCPEAGTTRPRKRWRE